MKVLSSSSSKTLIKASRSKNYSRLEYWQQKNRYYYKNLESLYRFLIPEGQRVLEIGSGTGSLLNAVKPSYGVGIDIVQVLCDSAQQRFPHLYFKAGAAEELEIEETFDYVILADTISCFEDIQRTFQQIRSVCTSSTRLIISFHNPIWNPILKLSVLLKQRMPMAPLNWLSHKDVANLLELSGFEVIKHGARLLLPKNIPFVAPLVNRFVAPLPSLNQLGLIEYVVARLRPHGFQIEENSKHTTCSVVIPARNEAGNIENCVNQLPKMGTHTEIIFVEGHSKDNTWTEIQRVQAKYSKEYTIKAIQQTKKGKGNAVREGFAIATGDILIIHDSDLTVSTKNLPYFFEALASGQCEFANGCRLIYPCSKEAMPFLNAFANRFFAFLLSFLIDIRIKDSLCGTKALSRINYQKIAENRKYFGEFDPFGDFDLLFGSSKLNLLISDIPVRYYPRTYGKSNIQHFKEGLILLRMCLYAARKMKFF